VSAETVCPTSQIKAAGRLRSELIVGKNYPRSSVMQRSHGNAAHGKKKFNIALDSPSNYKKFQF
jgi:hypothetical protein